MSLAAMKKRFLDGCRPVIGVDGCFLKGPFKGQLFVAVGRDGNHNMYPIAYVVVEAKTKDSWTWILETLVLDLGEHERHTRATFISDRQKVRFLHTITSNFCIPLGILFIANFTLILFYRVLCLLLRM
jgi:hypothetical protein